MIEKGDYAIIFDLYHHVDIHADYWQYLEFSWKARVGLLYIQSLPFGLATASLVFTKLLRPLVRR